MGLEKSIIGIHGGVATYWKALISELPDGGVEVRMMGFINKDMRIAGKAPIIDRANVFGPEYRCQDYAMLEAKGLNQKQYIYNILKQTESFTEAVDA